MSHTCAGTNQFLWLTSSGFAGGAAGNCWATDSDAASSRMTHSDRDERDMRTASFSPYRRLKEVGYELVFSPNLTESRGGAQQRARIPGSLGRAAARPYEDQALTITAWAVIRNCSPASSSSNSS